MKPKLPANVQPYVDKAAPVIAKVQSVISTDSLSLNLIAFPQIADLIEKAIPMIMLAYQKIMEFWKRISPYHPELLAPAFMGLVMCFFGGSYMTLIAAVEAYRLTGWESTHKCIVDLYEDFQKVAEANKKV